MPRPTRDGATRCSSVSLAIGEDQAGTASTVVNWLLLEQPGSWGYEAIGRSGLPDRVATAIRARARSLGIRVILIRRHGRSDAPGATAYFAHTGRAVRRLQRFSLAGGAADVLDQDWSPLVRGEPIRGGETDPGPLFLVCTNGARDVCCAERGRPLVRALQPAFGDRVWECSHIGGDRFAGNLVCFPHGLYFGRVGPGQAERVAGAYAQGKIDLDHVRGRSSHPFVVQAAEIFARRRAGLLGIDDLELIGTRAGPDGIHEAEFRGPGGPIGVRVRASPSDVTRRLTCKSEWSERPPVYSDMT